MFSVLNSLQTSELTSTSHTKRQKNVCVKYDTSYDSEPRLLSHFHTGDQSLRAVGVMSQCLFQRGDLWLFNERVFCFHKDSGQKLQMSDLMLMLMLTGNMFSRCSHTYGFVLLRQKNALPSGIGRTFSLGGARSAIFNWTPPSDGRRGGDMKREEERINRRLQQTKSTQELTIFSFRKLLLLLIFGVFIDVHLQRQTLRMMDLHFRIKITLRAPSAPLLPLPLQPPPPPPLLLRSSSCTNRKWEIRNHCSSSFLVSFLSFYPCFTPFLCPSSFTHSFFLSSPSPPARLSTAMAKKTFSRMSDTR